MSNKIKSMMEEFCKVDFNKALYQNVIRFCMHFETKGDHPQVLNSPYLGIIPIFFTNYDQDVFFSLFDTNFKEFKTYLTKNHLDQLSLALNRSELKKYISKVDSIDETRKVQSDPFNILVSYLVYKAYSAPKSSGLSDKEKEELVICLIKLLQYKFFTSLVNHRFPHKADPGTMQATIESLSNKFDITQYGTWKKVMEVRAESFIEKSSIHLDMMKTYDDDGRILYFITDVQTRIRNQINIVTTAYYQQKEHQNTVASYGVTGDDLEGTKVVIDQVSTFDSMTSNLTNEILSVHQFITPELITLMCKMHTNIRFDLFKSVLVRFSEQAILQSREKKPEKGLDAVNVVNNQEYYLGIRILVLKIIQKSYRHCMQNKVNMNSKLAILKALKDVYSSSRILDPNILSVRDSVSLFIDNCKVSKRSATVASLKLALILYVITKSFKYLK